MNKSVVVDVVVPTAMISAYTVGSKIIQPPCIYASLTKTCNCMDPFSDQNTE